MAKFTVVYPLETKQLIRDAFKNTHILAGGYDPAKAEADIQSGLGDLVAIGPPVPQQPRPGGKVSKQLASICRSPNEFAFFGR